MILFRLRLHTLSWSYFMLVQFWESYAWLTWSLYNHLVSSWHQSIVKRLHRWTELFQELWGSSLTCDSSRQRGNHDRVRQMHGRCWNWKIYRIINVFMRNSLPSVREYNSNQWLPFQTSEQQGGKASKKRVRHPAAPGWCFLTDPDLWPCCGGGLNKRGDFRTASNKA